MNFIMEYSHLNLLDKVAKQILFEDYRNHIRKCHKVLNILVVDDDPVSVKLIQAALKEYNVEYQSNVFKAIDEYWRIVPDIVFLDIELGNSIYNGFDILQTICSYDRNAHVIILSGCDNQKNIDDAIRYGAHSFISKPFSGEQLVNKVKKYLVTRNRKENL